MSSACPMVTPEDLNISSSRAEMLIYRERYKSRLVKIHQVINIHVDFRFPPYFSIGIGNFKRFQLRLVDIKLFRIVNPAHIAPKCVRGCYLSQCSLKGNNRLYVLGCICGIPTEFPNDVSIVSLVCGNPGFIGDGIQQDVTG